MRKQTHHHTTTLRCFLLSTMSIALLVSGGLAANAQMVTGTRMTDFAKVFGLDKNPAVDAYGAELTSSNIPGNILWPGDKLTCTIKVTNHRDTPLDVAGKIDIVAFGTKGKSGDIWVPTVIKIGDAGSIPVTIKAGAKATTTLIVAPDIPARFGAYALVLDLGPHLGRRFVVSCVRTFKPDPARVQYPALSLDDLGPEVLGAAGRSCHPLGRRLQADDRQGLRTLVSGAGRAAQGASGRGHHRAGDGRRRRVFRSRHSRWADRVPGWTSRTRCSTPSSTSPGCPAYDADFKKFVARFCADYGWPKGPITACLPLERAVGRHLHLRLGRGHAALPGHVCENGGRRQAGAAGGGRRRAGRRRRFVLQRAGQIVLGRNRPLSSRISTS